MNGDGKTIPRARMGTLKRTSNHHAKCKQSRMIIALAVALMIVALMPGVYIHVLLPHDDDPSVVRDVMPRWHTQHQALHQELHQELAQQQPSMSLPPFHGSPNALQVPFYIYDDIDFDWSNMTFDGVPFREMPGELDFKHHDDYWFYFAAQNHPMRTLEPSEAQLFFVPMLWNWVVTFPNKTVCTTTYDPKSPLPQISNYTEYNDAFCVNLTSSDVFEMNRRQGLLRLLNRADEALGRSPWFQRNGGKDHVLVASHPNAYSKIEPLLKPTRRTKAQRLKERREKYWIYRQFPSLFKAIASALGPYYGDESSPCYRQEWRYETLSNLLHCHHIAFESSMAIADETTEYMHQHQHGHTNEHQHEPLHEHGHLQLRQLQQSLQWQDAPVKRRNHPPNAVDSTSHGCTLSDDDRLRIPSFYIGTACEHEPLGNKIYDFSMIASINVDDPNFHDRMHLCDWLRQGNYSVGACGKGIQCPTLAKSKYGFHVRGDTWGANRLMDTVMSGTVPIFTAPQQYDIMPPFVPWKELSYFANMTNQQTFIKSIEYILSQPDSEYQRKAALVEAYQPLFDHRQPYQMDLYLTEVAKRLGMQQ